MVGLAVFSNGCASLGDKGERQVRKIPLRIERSEIAADYDVLVAEFALIDGDLEFARDALLRAAEKDPRSSVLHERLSRLAWQLDDLEEAVREAELALVLDSSSKSVRLFLGRLFRLRGDYKGLDRVLLDEAGVPLDSDSTYLLYQVAFEQDDLDRAEHLARRLIETEPAQLRSVLALAAIQEKRSEFDSAILTLREGLKAFPEHFLLYTRLAEIERASGNRTNEIEIYGEILEVHPGHYGILQRLGQAQFSDNRIESAIATFAEVVERYPDDVSSLLRLASLEVLEGRRESAMERLALALEGGGAQPKVAQMLGELRRMIGDVPGAIEAFDKIDREAPNYFTARLEIVSLLESVKRFDQALKEIDRLRVLRPDRRLDFQAAWLRIAAGNFEGGNSLLRNLLDGSEADAEVFYQLGIHYGTRGDFNEAVSLMLQVIEVDPNHARALNYIGYSWAERGKNLAEAEELIRRALEISPEDGYITDSLGWVYYKMAEILLEESRKEEALRLLERAHRRLIQAAEMTGGNSVISEHLGDVLLLRGEPRRALERFNEAVGLEPSEIEQPYLFEKRDRLRLDLDDSLESGGAP
jgi:tetratricopeptide (TPR) repeat protein